VAQIPPALTLIKSDPDEPTHFHTLYVTFVVRLPTGAILFRGGVLMDLAEEITTPEHIDAVRGIYESRARREFNVPIGMSLDVTILHWQELSRRRMTDEERRAQSARRAQEGQRRREEAEAGRAAIEKEKEEAEERERVKAEPPEDWESVRRRLGWNSDAHRSPEPDAGAPEGEPADVPDNVQGVRGDHGGAGEGEHGGPGRGAPEVREPRDPHGPHRVVCPHCGRVKGTCMVANCDQPDVWADEPCADCR
jgi:hypothetical protein